MTSSYNGRDSEVHERSIQAHRTARPFGPLDIQSTNPSLDFPFWAKSMRHNPLAAILKLLIGKTGHKRIGFGLQRFCEHPSCPFTRKLGQRVRYRFRLAKGQIVVSFFIGVLLLVRFWLASTPATVRRLSNHAITQISS
jgi:hypothetical protein